MCLWQVFVTWNDLLVFIIVFSVLILSSANLPWTWFLYLHNDFFIDFFLFFFLSLIMSITWILPNKCYIFITMQKYLLAVNFCWEKFHNHVWFRFGSIKNKTLDVLSLCASYIYAFIFCIYLSYMWKMGINSFFLFSFLFPTTMNIKKNTKRD